MAWFNKQDDAVPERLRNAKQEDLVSALDFYEKNKGKDPAAIEAELQAAKDKAAQLEAKANEVDILKAKISALEANQPRVTPTPQQTEPKNWLEDPDGALAERLAPMTNLALDIGTRTAQIQFENWISQNPGKYQDNPKLYKKFQKEMFALLSQENKVAQANPATWYNAFMLVCGTHQDEITEARANKESTFFGEAPKNTPVDQPNKSQEITDSDKTQADRWGITPEQVRDQRLKMKVVSV